MFIEVKNGVFLNLDKIYGCYLDYSKSEAKFVLDNTEILIYDLALSDFNALKIKLQKLGVVK